MNRHICCHPNVPTCNCNDHKMANGPNYFLKEISYFLASDICIKHYFLRYIIKMCSMILIYGRNTSWTKNASTEMIWTHCDLSVVVSSWNYEINGMRSFWLKLKIWWQLQPQHQSTYLRGPESASIEIPTFRPKFT